VVVAIQYGSSICLRSRRMGKGVAHAVQGTVYSNKKCPVSTRAQTISLMFELKLNYVGCSRSFGAFYYVEAYGCPLFKGAETI